MITPVIEIFADLATASTPTLLFVGVGIAVLSLFNVLAFRSNLKIGVLIFVVMHAIFGVLLFLVSQYDWLVHLVVYFLPSVMLAGLVYLFTRKEKVVKNIFDVEYVMENGKKIIVNIVKGFGIYGAAGSGKTATGVRPILKHCAENNFSGIVYDYKEFELTEIVKYYYSNSKIPIYIIYPQNPDLSYRINPIHPKYLESFNDVNTIASTMINNLSESEGKGVEKFFNEAAESALAGVIWRLKVDFPDYCSLPYAISIITQKERYEDEEGRFHDELVEFLQGHPHSRLLASTFLDSAGNSRQMAAVKSSLSNALRKISTPEMFYVFSGNDFELDLNNPAHPALMCLVNNPKYEAVLSPFLATVFQCSLNQMSIRGQNQSVLLLDEFPTIKLKDFQKIPATLRSYDIATVLGLQDKIQGVITYDENRFKAIMANLSATMVGKSNDPDTAKYYERFFEIVEEQQVSFSKATSAFSSSEARMNTSVKEKPKHRAYEFRQMKPGEFFMFDSNGFSHKSMFRMLDCTPIKAKEIYDTSQTELWSQFDQILATAKRL
ncbi:type IV secretory system conjugative DNA transfer family protein [Flexithrix dorotheae]|uniref:type IV secretory system conjugative DNA transfer family protein n=1 Tax=Flexithrix dorotheae TaxID=70993 RepID=UPI0003736A20|nr:type IV secretory system conjugative DNA transfer family protein [Flexithrix dorotheae]